MPGALPTYSCEDRDSVRGVRSAAWLDNAHKALDAAVAAAYGWADYRPEMPDEEILGRLLALNLVRAGE